VQAVVSKLGTPEDQKARLSVAESVAKSVKGGL